MEFEKKENIESEDLNKIAKIVIERIIDKLQGTDFSKSNTFDVENQFEKLILQATFHENLFGVVSFLVAYILNKYDIYLFIYYK